MENTHNVFFEDNQPVWFVAIDNKSWIGPLSPTDVVQKIQKNELTWAHYAWKQEQSQWMRICDIPTFATVVPSQPNKIVQLEVKEVVRTHETEETGKGGRPPQPPTSDKTWFLHYNESQFGPFSSEEIHRFLCIGKIHGEVYAWMDGMQKWEQLKQIQMFAESVEEAKRVRAAQKAAKAIAAAPAPAVTETAAATTSAAAESAAPTEKRAAPRFPLVARSLMSSKDAMFVAICRDISIGGMQVLTDRIPGPPGTKLKLNVSPSADNGATGKGSAVTARIEPFVAEGVVVRILEDGRGFSFRFENLTEAARGTIEDYIRSL